MRPKSRDGANDVEVSRFRRWRKSYVEVIKIPRRHLPCPPQAGRRRAHSRDGANDVEVSRFRRWRKSYVEVIKIPRRHLPCPPQAGRRRAKTKESPREQQNSGHLAVVFLCILLYFCAFLLHALLILARFCAKILTWARTF